MAFGRYKYTNIIGDKGNDWNVELWGDGFSGTAEEFSTTGAGFSITWTGAGSTRATNFLGSQCTIDFLIKDNSDEAFVYDVMSSGFQKYYVRIYKGSVVTDNIWWFGWIQPSFDVIQNISFPYTYSLIATDSVGYLNQLKPLSFANHGDKLYSASFLTHMFNTFQAGTSTGLNIGGGTTGDNTPSPDLYRWLRTSADWWREGDAAIYDTTNPLNLYSFCTGGFADETKYDDEGEIIQGGNPLSYKAQDVFKGGLKIMGLKGFLAEGKYNLIQPNLLQNNNTGALKTYTYSGFGQGTTIENITTILTIDQENNNLLGGSSFTYEPPLESVSIQYSQGASSFAISNGSNMEAVAFPVGYLIANAGHSEFKFVVHNYIEVLKNDFSFSSNHDVFSNSYTNTCDLEVKLSDGVDDYYLQTYDDSDLYWVLSNSTPLTLTITRGLSVPFNEPLNDPGSNMQTGDTSNTTAWNSGDIYPCKRTQIIQNSIYKYNFRTLIRFIANVQPAPISGSVTMGTATTNVYKQRAMNTADFATSINTPTPIFNRTDVIEVTFEPVEGNETQSTAQEVEFRATQTEILALDTEDLGTLPIGQRLTGTDQISVNADFLYSVQYTAGTQTIPATQGFRNGNSGGYAPIMRLVCEEYLTPQVAPLQIMQADIKSADISPLKVIKYSLNNDGNYNYYQFLGGTFKASTEVLSGEWYLLKSDPTYVTGGESSFMPIDSNPYTNASEMKFRSINNIQKRDKKYRSFDVYGVLDTDIVAGININKVEFAANSAAKIYDNQKLRLSYPDGSSSITIVSDGDNLTTSDQVNIDIIAPLIDYPAGCILSPMITDLSNVITAGSNTPNLALGVTTTKIYIKPDQFKTWTSSSIQSYTRDTLGSVQPSAYASRTKVFASTFVPAGYKVTGFQVFSSQNRAIQALSSRVSSDNIGSLGTGTANTFQLITAWNSVNGDYFILTYEIGASTDEIYGAELDIALI